MLKPPARRSAARDAKHQANADGRPLIFFSCSMSAPLRGALTRLV
jgi:hypothetical protein